MIIWCNRVGEVRKTLRITAAAMALQNKMLGGGGSSSGSSSGSSDAVDWDGNPYSTSSPNFDKYLERDKYILMDYNNTINYIGPRTSDHRRSLS